ncbi:aspartate-semialdehyde dehydrogenase [Streptomyces sp. NBC_01006]|uniref:aspartate-semialdehyde dehydrogenase n=1 Tax=Streptomyces sp. NBC_01006 TaxID=2903716 RepID=UPI002F90B6D6|nr:aspartate-semialdehyde dehydrogenase [Streptomyces sp. NBC_01006]
MTLVSDPSAPRIAIIGATGAVGGTLVELFEERGLPYRELYLVASPRSAGREVCVAGRYYTVRDLEEFDFGSVDLAFFSAGTAVSERWVPRATAAGALVIDNTRAFRMDPATPLVVPQVNGAELDRRPDGGTVANPNCSTIPLVRLLDAVGRRWGLRRVVVSTYQAASGLGHSGIEELQEASALALQDPGAEPLSKRFTPSLAFNVLPQIDEVLESGFTREEEKLLHESRRILGQPGLDVTATCVRVPVVNGHSESVWVECAGEVERGELVALLGALPEVSVYDGPQALPPVPAALEDPDRVHVGRIRVSPNDPRGFWLWLVADNLRVGAALNAVQIAEQLLARGTL